MMILRTWLARLGVEAAIAYVLLVAGLFKAFEVLHRT